MIGYMHDVTAIQGSWLSAHLARSELHLTPSWVYGFLYIPFRSVSVLFRHSTFISWKAGLYFLTKP